MVIETNPIVRRKLSDEVVDRFKALITSGKLKPGETVPSERELMEVFHVGRPAIREAMQTLSNLGLLTITHGERSKVRQITVESIIHQVDAAATVMLATSPSSLDHLKSARIFFERGMVREAALKAGPGQIEALRATISAQKASLGDADSFIEADMRFHTQIAAISGNPIFEGVSEAMLNWLKAYHTEMLIWTGKEKYTLTEHEEIVRQIERHDPDEAETAIVHHLERSAALYASANGTGHAGGA